MNYYQYKRRAPKSRATDFIKPFILIVIFAGIIVAGWRLLASMGGETPQPLTSEKVFLEVETGSAKAMTSGSKEWKSVPTGIYLYEGEELRTQSDGRVTLTFFEQDIIRLDKSSEMMLRALSNEGNTHEASLALSDGKLWAVADQEASSPTKFTIDTGLLTLKSSGGVFAVSHPGMLYVLSGSVNADIKHEGDVIKSVTVGIGQELILDKSISADLSEGLDKEIIFALDDAFKSSNWYRWNQQQEGSTLENDELDEPEDTDEDSEIVEGSNDDEVDEADAEVADSETDDENDDQPPTKPEVTEPGNDGDTITLTGTKQDIKGKVSADTETVIVNDYRLTRYTPGSKEFRYTASTAFGNLEVGENEYEIIAEDKAGNKSVVARITLILPQDIYDEAQEEIEPDAKEETTPSASSSGGVSITDPNNGDNLHTSETAFEIKGVVPEGTTKVLINDYQLQGFSEGDTNFLYRANSTLGTLKIGALNTYTVKAYGVDDQVLGTASMTIDVESGSNGNGAPTITIPTASGNYETTLDQLVIGGAVGKWITRVKINGENINEYIPGTEEWKITVTLSPGENIFEICAEQEGESKGCSSIQITFQG